MSTIVERVTKLVCEQLGVKEEEVTPEASFVEDLGADSLDTVELVMALEEEFETEIPDEEAEKITTVKEAIDYIEANERHRSAPEAALETILVGLVTQEVLREDEQWRVRQEVQRMTSG